MSLIIHKATCHMTHRKNVSAKCGGPFGGRFDGLFNNKQMQHTMKTIRSSKHELGSYEINKISLSCFDDKRFLHDNGITSYAYGNWRCQLTT